jgi:hypothetical protein
MVRFAVKFGFGLGALASEPANNKMISSQRHETQTSQTAPGGEAGWPPPAAADPAGSIPGARGWMRWPGWARILLGRVILRVCSSGKKECRHERCHLRVFCNCAREEFERAASLEKRLWTVLALCAALVIGYCLLL